ncbi:Toprim-like [Novosphingobium sp. CF614]|uniref:toprim domain-containing protein n=1 Tax=Novosphingobium sp. CF614 TaxID=1884364 RepID=UPI0008E54FC5|nr:toprim domain-containing protein [Novosphingobium sp. CF614]SFG08974.1 Toprim-like [Novosphingobium sp. CF614]
MNLEAEILKGLQDKFGFRKTGGEWLQEGKCPDCKNLSVFCAAKDPKIVRCGKGKCGSEWTVRALLPNLFEDWSRRFPATDQNPNAAADGYLSHERGLDLQLLRGAYTQELFRDGKTGHTSATVRFKVGDTWWERIIDKPGRFAKKAHFQYGGKPGGHCWMPPKLTIEDFGAAEDIWIAEGIFNAQALHQGARLLAVSAMSCNYWPEHFLELLRAELQRIKRPTRPRLVFAFDPGEAGPKWARRFVRQARDEGWPATAAQVRPDGEGTSKDWNDLLLDHQSWKGDAEKAPLGPEKLEEYLWNGAVTIAETRHEKAELIYQRKKFPAFDFRHGNRLWWCKVTYDEDVQPNFNVDELANCAFRFLYTERDEVEDITNYFLQIDFPARATVKARFSSNAIAKAGEFDNRLHAFTGMWLGTQEQLNRIKKPQMGGLKEVTPVKATGYSEPHRAWLLGDIAVRDGELKKLNADKFFDFGKQAVKLYSEERMLSIHYDPDKLDFDWLPDLWTAYGPKGLVALAFFMMSLFAVQIRGRDGSLGFLEITGMPGSGKTTLVVFLWKLLGRNNHEGNDPNNNSAAFLPRIMMRVSNLPVGLIEGKRDDDKNRSYRSFDYNDLLTLYNGRNPRGTARKSTGFEVSEPPFNGTIYLMQNERIDAHEAVLERLMSMPIDKSRFSETAAEAATRLKRWPIDRLSGTIVHVVRQEAAYLPAFFERFEKHNAAMGKRVDGLFNDRCILNHAQLAAAVEALPRIFPNMRPEWTAETLQLVDAMAMDRQNSCGGDHPLVSRFWEQVDYLIDREKPDDHFDGKSLNQHRDPALIAVRLVEYEARCRGAGLTPPDMDKLKKVLRNSKSRKWLATKNVNNPAGQIVSCWIFEMPARLPV